MLATQMEAAADQAKKMVSERGMPVQVVRSKSHKITNKQLHSSAKYHATNPPHGNPTLDVALIST